MKVDNDKCLKCGGCVSICPVNALEIIDNQIVWDSEKCINCGACERFCPVGALKIKVKENDD